MTMHTTKRIPETMFRRTPDVIAQLANDRARLVEALRDAMHQVKSAKTCRAIQDLLVSIGEIK